MVSNFLTEKRMLRVTPKKREEERSLRKHAEVGGRKGKKKRPAPAAPGRKIAFPGLARRDLQEFTRHLYFGRTL